MKENKKWEVFRHFYLMLSNEDDPDIKHSEKINNWIKETIHRLCEDKAKIQTIPQVGFLCALFPFYDHNIFGDDALILIESMMQLQPAVSSYLWFAILNEKCQIENWDKHSFIRLLQILIDQCDSDKSRNSIYEYQLEKVINKYNNIIIKEYPEDFASIFINWCLKLEKESPLKFGGISTVALDDNYTFLDKTETLIINMLKNIITCSNKAAQIVLHESVFSPSIIVSKLQVYAISTHFDMFKDILFSITDNPLNQKNLIGDLFNLVEVNKSKFNKDEIATLYYWIIQATFGYKSYKDSPEEDESWKNNIKVCKYSFLKSLSEVCSSLNDELVKYYVDDYANYPDMYDRSWVFKDFEVGWMDGKEVQEKLDGKSIEEIIEFYCNEDISGEEAFERGIALRSVIQDRNSGVEEIELLLNKIPLSYHNEILLYITNNSFLNDPTKCFYLVKKDLDNNLDQVFSKDYINNYLFCFDNLFSQYYKHKELIIDICDYLLTFTTKFKNRFQKEKNNKPVEWDVETNILNTWYCIPIKTILGSIYFAKDEALIERTKKFISSWLNSRSPKKNLIYSALCVNSNYIIGIDEAWASVIFNKVLNNDNISIILNYAKWSSFLYYLILEKYSKKEIALDSKWANKFLQWCIYYSVYYNNDLNEIYNTIIHTYNIDSFSKGVFQLLSMVGNNRNEAQVCRVLTAICESFNDTIISEDKETDNLINIFADVLYNLNIVNETMWESFIKLANGFKSFISEKTVAFLLNSFEKYEEKVATVVESMVKNSSDWAFAYESDFDKLIIQIGQKEETKKIFNRINSTLIDRGIYRFKDINI